MRYNAPVHWVFYQGTAGGSTFLFHEKNAICDNNPMISTVHNKERRAREFMVARSKDTTAFFRTSYHEHTGVSFFVVHVGGDYYRRWQFFVRQKGKAQYTISKAGPPALCSSEWNRQRAVTGRKVLKGGQRFFWFQSI